MALPAKPMSQACSVCLEVQLSSRIGRLYTKISCQTIQRPEGELKVTSHHEIGVTFSSPGHLTFSLSLHPHSGDIVRKRSNPASLTSVLSFYECVLEESCDFSTYQMLLSEQTPRCLGLLKVGPEANPSEMETAPE